MKKSKGIIFLGIGFELLGVVLTSAYIGSLIDKHYKLNGFGLAGFILFGMGMWIYHLVFLLKKYMDSEED